LNPTYALRAEVGFIYMGNNFLNFLDFSSEIRQDVIEEVGLKLIEI